MFNDCKDLAQVTQRVYQANSLDTSWPETNYKLICINASESYKKSWDMLNDVIRASATNVCVERAQDPLKESSIQLSKSIDDEIKTRRTLLKDFDSYRRRLKALHQKRDSAEVLTFYHLRTCCFIHNITVGSREK
jgi:hypothetical protein